MGQNFRKFPQLERRYYIEKMPMIRRIPGITVIFTMEDDRRSTESQQKNFCQILKFAKKCINLMGLHWKAAVNFRNRDSSLYLKQGKVVEQRDFRKSLYDIISTSQCSN